MNRRLAQITDWPNRASTAKYCVKTLAANCDISVRTLERHFKLKFSLCPHSWMLRIRMQHAAELLMDGTSVKETAGELSYKNPHHFAREFKKHTGLVPSHYASYKSLPR